MPQPVMANDAASVLLALASPDVTVDNVATITVVAMNAASTNIIVMDNAAPLEGCDGKTAGGERGDKMFVRAGRVQQMK